MPKDEAPFALTIADTLRRVQARDDAPAPDPAFVSRLEETLMNHAICVDPHRLTNTQPAASGRWHEHVPQPRTPYRPRLAAAAIVLVLLTIASGVVATRQDTPSDPRGESQRLAAVQIATPDTNLCTIAPRTDGPIGETTVYDSAFPPPEEEGYAAGYPFITSDDQIPRGDPAPSEAVAGIVRTIRAHNACQKEYPGASTEVPSEEAIARELAFYSDDYLRRSPTVGPLPTPPITDLNPRIYPPAWHPQATAYMDDEVQAAWVLPDGRVSAIVGDPWGQPALAIFVYDGEWWLIDELAFNAIDEPRTTATPPVDTDAPRRHS